MDRISGLAASIRGRMLGLQLVGKEALRNHGDGDKLRRRDAEQRESPKHNPASAAGHSRFCALGSLAVDIRELCGRPIALANPSANGEYVSRPRSAACAPAELAVAQAPLDAIMMRDVAETLISLAVSGGAGQLRATQQAVGMGGQGQEAAQFRHP